MTSGLSKPVLFATGLGKEKYRAENIRTLYEAYQGEKEFISMHDAEYCGAIVSGKYDLMVADIFPDRSPGKCIMMWHAIQGGKLIGIGQKNGTYYRPDYARFMDRIVVAGKGAIGMFNQCTGVPKERILNLGMPRTDKYIGKRKGDGHTFLAAKKAYLFVPTFREREETSFPCIDWKWIDEQLTDDEVFAVKSHPYGSSWGLEQYKHLCEIPKMESTSNYLMDADVVITDYSSTMFDAWLLNKPVVLFEKKRGYTETRGMYLRYPEGYSERYATNEAELLQHIRTAKAMTLTERNCREYVADMCDGHSCERICELIERMNNNG